VVVGDAEVVDGVHLARVEKVIHGQPLDVLAGEEVRISNSPAGTAVNS
jgi:hypothetical protein